MSRFIPTFLVLAALWLSGCASEVAGPGPAAPDGPKPGRIVLAPSDDVYQAAMAGLSAREREIFKKGLGFTVDTLVVAPTRIEGMPFGHTRRDMPTQVSMPDFVRYLDRLPALKGPVRVNLATVRVNCGITYDQAIFGPQFQIQMVVEFSSSSAVSVGGFSGGPMCSRFGESSALASPQFTRSAQVAFMRAFLKTLLKINDQVQQG